MTGESKGKYFSRVMAVLFMGLAFAACATMLSTGQRSLFADSTPYVADGQ